MANYLTMKAIKTKYYVENYEEGQLNFTKVSEVLDNGETYLAIEEMFIGSSFQSISKRESTILFNSYEEILFEQDNIKETTLGEYELRKVELIMELRMNM